MYIPDWIKDAKRSLGGIRRPAPLLTLFTRASVQVNLLSNVSGCLFLFAIVSGLFPALKPVFGYALVSVGLVVAIAWLNERRYPEAANVVFYLFLNALIVAVTQATHARAVTVILGYVTLLSLIVFLFQAVITRISCLVILVFRIILFELKAGDSSVGVDVSTVPQNVRFFLDFAMILHVILVFVLYAIRMYAIEQAQRQNALFAQHMSHDLQVTYHAQASIIAHLHLIAQRRGAEKISGSEIDELANASGFYSFILNNFLEFSRYEKATIGNNHYEEIDLTSELEKILELHRYMAEEKCIQMDLVVDDHLPLIIRSDKVKITRIVLNLLTNALKNTPSGKRIVVSVRWKGGSWQLSVANEGNGISPEEIVQLFTPYETKKIRPASGRLGMGLPITKVLTEALGGQITASSEPGHPTLFTVEIPVR